MIETIRYYWKLNVAVMFAAAIAAAVLTGALLVGDSVRGSLRDLTLERLGKVDYAVVSENMFRKELADQIAAQQEHRVRFENTVPGFAIPGTAIHANSNLRASGVQVYGIDPRFIELFPMSGEEKRGFIAGLSQDPSQVIPPVIINEALRNELKAQSGDEILLNVQQFSEIHRESVLGKRDPEELKETLRLVIRRVLPDQGIGRFGLRANQNLPFNAFVPISIIQNGLGQSGKANTIFLSARSGFTDKADDFLSREIQTSWKLNDLGLVVRNNGNQVFSLESNRLILSDPLAQSALKVSGQLHQPHLEIFTYLANTIVANGRTIPYSTITALKTPLPEFFGSLNLMNGTPVPALNEGELLLNEWAAQELGAQPDTQIEISYYVIGSGNELITRKAKLKLKGIVRMEGFALDRTVTPEYPGIQNAKHIADWSPPFPVNLALIRPQDEDYWEHYGAAPKGFVSDTTGKALWGSRFGNLTSIRFSPSPSKNLHESANDFVQALLKSISPESAGFSFQAVKAEGLRSATGSTDFGMLFTSFSIFLILSAALMTGLLYRLGVEQRASEIGILLSVGYGAKGIRRKFLQEGFILAGIGSLLGLALSLAYAWSILTALRTWWIAAVGTPFVTLHVTLFSLLLGYVISLAVVLFSIHRAIGKMVRIPPPLLLGKFVQLPEQTGPSRFISLFILIPALLAGILTIYATMQRDEASANIFFGVGSLILISGLSVFVRWLKTSSRSTFHGSGALSFFRMAVRSTIRNPLRSALSVALVCCACFVIVAVGANRKDSREELSRKNSGTGGYSLLAQSDLPLLQNLNDASDRSLLGMPELHSLDHSHFVGLRLLPGDDASCLNLYKPQKPRLLGVPGEFIKRGGFRFRSSLASNPQTEENPWRLLGIPEQSSIIPAIGDYNSVNWILHSGLGKDVIIQDDFGKPVRLRIMALLEESIFQSELLISEENFKQHFPSRAGYSYFLIETTPQSASAVAHILEDSLSDFGFDVVATDQKLNSYLAVENTYLSTFQTLGALGLLLGTFGLAVVLIRNVFERRGELAALRAFGFRKSRITLLILLENTFLLVAGIVIGAISALIAVAPHMLQDPEQIPWVSLALTLLIVATFGFVATAVASSVALGVPLLPELKAE